MGDEGLNPKVLVIGVILTCIAVGIGFIIAH